MLTDTCIMLNAYTACLHMCGSLELLNVFVICPKNNPTNFGFSTMSVICVLRGIYIRHLTNIHLHKISTRSKLHTVEFLLKC